MPFPGSLVFWGVPGYRKLHEELPLALQVPLLLTVARHRAVGGFRVPQSGFLHEPTADKPHAGDRAHLVKNTYRRTHRWDKILRDQDELALAGKEQKLLHVLFSTIPEDIDLYDKPMARNVQLWTEDYQLLLDGPTASPERLKRARCGRSSPAGSSATGSSGRPCGSASTRSTGTGRSSPTATGRAAASAARRAARLPDRLRRRQAAAEKAIELWPRLRGGRSDRRPAAYTRVTAGSRCR